ncbi:LacI family DNA-binding transcriptional regulator [Agromyces aerolatus]|uniref:LacI family DNA-binding transcriptional regulator n=1 Tax=Agromyces sp. LY-1074 TaxID=3074080 RepID=UPI00285A97CF|nr:MULTISPECIES: LacI family DNA-binding transcriptional regulator [unclassified Agromyces]MDR5699042.1 LacI family DNA-binding transcriptional regulator [Agromyces sp. LY-1074]MDR5705180.1 LacI family DNA-binding transcriptional regulator [Agromyces sp. LY-1358]
MAATLRMVAEAASVSLSTASRALQGSPRISPATRKRVRSVAADLGYRPNHAARALRSRRSRLVGLVLNNLVNVSFHTIAEVVQRKLSAEGYQLIISITDGDPRVEKELLMTLVDHGVDGVIVIGSGLNAATTNEFLESDIAVVNAIRSSPDSRAPTVLAGDRDGAYTAVRYLLELGHRRVGYIGGLDSTDSGRERFRGYREALADSGVELDDRLISKGPFTPTFGADAIDELLAVRPGMTALFAANHEAVFGIMPGLVAADVELARELSLICYEDMPLLQMWQTPVTVVDTGAEEIGALAVDLLLDQIDLDGTTRGPEGAPRKVNRTYRVGAQLVQRQSCAPPRS